MYEECSLTGNNESHMGFRNNIENQAKSKAWRAVEGEGAGGVR
jgi:hypothetical protein